MAKVNTNFLKLQARYLFSEIAKRANKFIADNPEAPVIKLGIGDTTRPLPPTIIKAFHDAVDEMANESSYRGYGPEQGHAFLREAIAKYDYNARGVDIQPDEIFISDGSKCDTGNILDIFGKNVIAVSDPSYPVYVDTNVMAGNTGEPLENGQYEGLIYLPCSDANKFVPATPDQPVDLIYLCSPNNPTGTAMTKEDLTKWVEFAKKNKAIIFYDAAYERFITEDHIPRSIYEIEGAKEVAIEFRSFSKTAGFTGTRCALTVVPKALMGQDEEGKDVAIHPIWNRRHNTKFNGVSYPVQRAAAAVYSDEGKKEVDQNISYYQENAKTIREGLSVAGFTIFGGINSPYIWVKTPNNMTSWDFFNLLLEKLNIVGTPGSGFGPSGQGYFRLTAFGSQENTKIAIERIKSFDWKNI